MVPPAGAVSCPVGGATDGDDDRGDDDGGGDDCGDGEVRGVDDPADAGGELLAAGAAAAADGAEW